MVERYEAKLLNAALREQEPIERIARHRFTRNGRKDVMLVDRDKFECPVRHDVGQEFEIAREFVVVNERLNRQWCETKRAMREDGEILCGVGIRSSGGAAEIADAVALPCIAALVDDRCCCGR